MDGYNVCNFMGNLAADSELRAAGKEMVLNFRIACTESFKDREGQRKERTTFVPCVLWGKRGEALAPHLLKGKQVFVTGSFNVRSYEKDGEKRYATDIRVNDVILCGGGGRGQDSEGGGSRSRQSPREDYPRGGGYGGGAARAPAPEPADDGGGFGADDDIPFMSQAGCGPWRV